MILIRDGNAEAQKKHKGTKLTEFFSVEVFKFNKSLDKQLWFTDKTRISKFAEKHHLSLQIDDHSKLTSNTVFILKKIGKS
jgi:hypothetical protein